MGKFERLKDLSVGCRRTNSDEDPRWADVILTEVPRSPLKWGCPWTFETPQHSPPEDSQPNHAAQI